MRATDEVTKVGRAFRMIVSLKASPLERTHIIREGLDTACQRGDLDGQHGHLFRQDSYLFRQSQEFIGKYQATKLRPPLRMCFDKAYEIMELISSKRHVCSLRCVLPQRIPKELYAAMVLHANSWALCSRGTFVSQSGRIAQKIDGF